MMVGAKMSPMSVGGGGRVRNRLRTICKKNWSDRFSNFTSPGPAESVPGPVVTNSNECAMFSAPDGAN